MEPREVSGTIRGIGVGPGDPELVTLKAVRLARAAPVLAFPAPENGESLARRIMAPHLEGTRIEIAIRMPISTDRFPVNRVYDAAAAEIADHARAGRDVAILCLGDPFFYGSFMYLFARLAEQASLEIVPGVTSVSAAAARLGFPLAARSDVMSVVPALLDDAALERQLVGAESLAILKLGRHFARVRALLQRLGLATQARYIERASFADERVLPLEAVDPAAVPYFSLILVHRRGMAWR
jgi:precorrin-2/cobalt-factor-2 C20-methyltransferase